MFSYAVRRKLVLPLIGVNTIIAFKKTKSEAAKRPHVCIVEAAGGGDKATTDTGNRFDSILLKKALLESNKVDVSIVAWTSLMQDVYDIYIYRVNPGDKYNEDFDAGQCHAFLILAKSSGKVVIPDQALLSILGHKKLLVDIKDSCLGVPDTRLLSSLEEVAGDLILIGNQPRVYKIDYGSQGFGVWVVFAERVLGDCAGYSYRCVPTNHIQQPLMTASAMEAARYMFTKDCLVVSQQFMPSIKEKGEVRVVLTGTRPVEIVTKIPQNGSLSAALLSGAVYTVFQPEEVPTSVADALPCVQQFIPELCKAVGIEETDLPFLWTVDMIRDEQGALRLSEVNCTCVGFSKQPHLAALVAEHIISSIPVGAV